MDLTPALARLERIQSAAGELLREASLLQSDLESLVEDPTEEPPVDPPVDPPVKPDLVAVAHATLAGFTYGDDRGVAVGGVVSGTKRKLRPGSEAVRQQWLAAVAAVGGTVEDPAADVLIANIPDAWGFRMDGLPAGLDFSQAAREAFAVGVITVEGSTQGLVLDDPDPGHRAAFRALLLALGVGTTEERQKVYAYEGDWPVIQSWPFAAWGRVPGGQPADEEPDPEPEPEPAAFPYIAGTLWREYPTGKDAAWVWANVDGIVVNHTWRDLESSRLDLIAELDDCHARGKRCLLRIGMGEGAPDVLRTMTWTTNKGAANQAQTYDILIAPYWTVEVQRATAAFLARLGVEVGDHPALAGVAVPMGTQFEEPISPSQLNIGTNLQRATSTGWSPDARDTWLMTVAALTASAFPGQYLYMPLNPPGSVVDGKFKPGNAQHALALAGRMLSEFGDRLVLGNNSWSVVTEWNDEARVMYEGTKDLTGRFGFQTETYVKMGNSVETAARTMQDAADFGAISVELPRGVQGMNFDTVRAGLKANLGG